jgi:hypothetical protein
VNVLSCPQRNNYLLNTNTQTKLEEKLVETLKDISSVFGPVSFKGIQRALDLIRRTDGQLLINLPDFIQIWKLDNRNWNQIADPAIRGRYYSIGNKIILNDDKWCRKTLIHECLHGLSIFSHPCNSDTFNLTKLFNEGITEFLTGYLLWKKFNKCYNDWKLSTFPKWCNMSYRKETKIFFAFCGCVNIQSLTSLYFGTQSNNFYSAWSSFIKDIRRVTSKKFTDVLTIGQRIGLTNAFKNECERIFKKKLQKNLDYSIFP